MTGSRQRRCLLRAILSGPQGSLQPGDARAAGLAPVVVATPRRGWLSRRTSVSAPPMAKPGRQPGLRRVPVRAGTTGLVVHVPAVTGAGGRRLLLRDVRDERLRGQDHRRDRGGVLN